MTSFRVLGRMSRRHDDKTVRRGVSAYDKMDWNEVTAGGRWPRFVYAKGLTARTKEGGVNEVTAGGVVTSFSQTARTRLEAVSGSAVEEHLVEHVAQSAEMPAGNELYVGRSTTRPSPIAPGKRYYDQRLMVIGGSVVQT